MPRNYKCKTCGVEHPPPTGKHCPERRNIEGAQAQAQAQAAERGPEVMTVLMEVKRQMEDMQKEMKDMRQEREQLSEIPSPLVPSISVQSTPQADEVDQDTRSTGAVAKTNTAHSRAFLSDSDSEPASPETLRRDRRLMREATRRLGRLTLREFEADEQNGESNAKTTGKRSGSVMTATDKVVHTVDWPHMYIRRIIGGKRKGVSFADLAIDEFVYGFLTMLEAPKNAGTMDFRGMIRLLKNLMQDSMEFSWANARGFYEHIGLDVEYGIMQWADEQVIHEKRMTYARTIFPARKDVKEQQKPALLPAPPNTKCCAPYQRKACEHDRDHHPFVHACAYCHRTKTAICRHPEEECYRKTNDATKNGRAGGTTAPPAQ